MDSILRSGTLPEAPAEATAAQGDAANFKQGMGLLPPVTLVQTSSKRPDKVFHANVISDGDPLEIYTDKDGGVIFKKYSLMGGLSDFANQMCETLNKTTGRVSVITDRDTCIAVAGTARRELADKRVSGDLESIMEGRQIYQRSEGDSPLPICEENDKYQLEVAAPILSEGDVLGCVTFISTPGDPPTGDSEYKLAQAIAGFLGRHMES